MRLRVVILAALLIMFTLPTFALQIRINTTNAADVPPIAAFKYSPQIPTPRESVIFDASASYDVDGSIVRFSWDFGDGATSTASVPTATHSYAADGNYTVQLTVTDNSGSTGFCVSVLSVNHIVFFRAVYKDTLVPFPNVQVTMYYYDGHAWAIAPAASCGAQILYDRVTQPDLADTHAESYRNPGYTASILKDNASNIGWDVHQGIWKVYFQFKYLGAIVSTWPNAATRVYSYANGMIQSHDYSPGHQAYWDPSAGNYVIQVKDISWNGVSPTESHPILVWLGVPIPQDNYYLNVRTSPVGIVTIPGQGSYISGTNATLNAPTYVDSSSTLRYRFSHWDVDGIPHGIGVNAITVQMLANHTTTAHYMTQYCAIFAQTGLSTDAIGTVTVIDGIPKTYTDLPYMLWIDSGSTLTYSYSSQISTSIDGKRYSLNLLSGPSSPVAVSSAVSFTGNYAIQHSVTFGQTGLDSTANSAIVTVNELPKAFSELPYVLWVEEGSSVTYSYNAIVSTSMPAKSFMLASVSGPASPLVIVTGTILTGGYVIANNEIQYEITFGLSGVGSDFTGAIVTIDGTSYDFGQLPVTFWWDSGSVHSYSFNSPLAVSAGKQYVWSSTSGLTSLQSGTITVSRSGNTIGNYFTQTKPQVTFVQTGVNSDLTGTVLIVDGVGYGVVYVPITFWWDFGSVHTYTYQSTLVVSTNSKQYIWTGTTGLSTLRTGSITVTSSGSLTGNYDTQYYLAVGASPSGTALPIGEGWYDQNTFATISTAGYVDITLGSSRYRFNGWATADMLEITDPTASPTTVLIDKSKTITANYVLQYKVTYSTDASLDFTGIALTVDDNDYPSVELPLHLWLDGGTSHAYYFKSPLAVSSSKRYTWVSTIGLSTSQTGTFVISVSGNISASYKVQYYVTINSPYGSPAPGSTWVDSGYSLTESIVSPVAGPTGTRYICTGYTGNGNASPSGSGTSATFTVTQPSAITWIWKTQYYLAVTSSPVGVVAISGEGWYDSGSSISLNAPTVGGFAFDNWNVNGVSKDVGVTSILVTMSEPRLAIAHYAMTTAFSVQITPTDTTIHEGQTVIFTSSVNGGTAPLEYQWVLDSQNATGATSNTWEFVPTGLGTHYIRIVVRDSHGWITQSANARVIVTSASVGGYSVTLAKHVSLVDFAMYAVLVFTFAAVLILARRKGK